MSSRLEDSRAAAVAWMPSLRDGLERALRASDVTVVSLSSRVKSLEAVSEKLKRTAGSGVNDLIGFRVVLPDRTALSSTADSVAAWGEAEGLERKEVEDRFDDPGLGGYRAMHLDFAVADPAAHGLDPEAGVEVQLTTAILAAHAAACHELVYRRRAESAAPELVARVRKLGDEADRLDRELAAMRRRTPATPSRATGG